MPNRGSASSTLCRRIRLLSISDVTSSSDRTPPGVNASLGNCLRGLQGEAAGKDRQAPEHRSLIRVEEVIAPGDRVAQRLVPGRRFAGAAHQQRQPRIQTRQERLRGEHLAARRRQLDRQRQPVEAAAELRDGARVLVCQGKVGFDLAGALGEQPDRRVPAQIRGRCRGMCAPAAAAVEQETPARRPGAAAPGSWQGPRAGDTPAGDRRRAEPPPTRARSCRAPGAVSASAEGDCQVVGQGSIARQSRTPSACATVGPTRAASRTGASETKTTPAAKSAVTPAAASSASRVLPTPPGPVSVTSETSVRRSNSRTAATSRSRPISGVRGSGRFWDRVNGDDAPMAAPPIDDVCNDEAILHEEPPESRIRQPLRLLTESGIALDCRVCEHRFRISKTRGQPWRHRRRCLRPNSS